LILLLIPQHIRRRFAVRRLWLIDLLVTALIVSVLFLVAYRHVESVSWEEAAWQVWQTATTVGFGNRPARTLLGRMATMFFGLIDIAILGATIGAIFDEREDRRARRRSGLMKNPHKDGYVLFNYPGTSRFQALVAELRYVEREVPICVVDDRIDELPPGAAGLDNVHFIHGSILSRETYERARLRDNTAVIVFPLEASLPESDGTTRTVVDLVGHFVDETTRILHVLVSAENGWMFDEFRSTAIMEHLEMLALVQECQDTYSAPIVQRLLMNTEGANPDTVKPVRTVGWTWSQFVISTMLASGDTGVHVNPLALVKVGEEPMVAPSPDAVIGPEDHISLISFPGFDWDKFEAGMASSSGMDSNG
jgi:voltage-gated potassium channel